MDEGHVSWAGVQTGALRWTNGLYFYDTYCISSQHGSLGLGGARVSSGILLGKEQTREEQELGLVRET